MGKTNNDERLSSDRVKDFLIGKNNHKKLTSELQERTINTMIDKTTNIQTLKDKVLKFVQARNWDDFHSPKNLAMSIAIEASELMEIFQWLNEEESKNIMNTDENIHLQEELADIIIYCLSLSNRLNIDVSSAIEDKIKKNGIKYPIEPSKD